jgi:Tol biopolymer transport system component
VWSPDGTKIIFADKTTPRYELFLKHLDASAQEEPLDIAGTNVMPTDWSRDWIVFRQDGEKTSQDIWLRPAGGGKPVAFLQTPTVEADGHISPDGHWMTYAQLTAGRAEVFVQAISAEGPATGLQYRVSSSGGSAPRWRRDGKELLYATTDGVIIAVPITLGATFQQGAAQTLFKPPQGAVAGNISSDGQRFLFAVPGGTDRRSNSLTVVLNWPEALKK